MKAYNLMVSERVIQIVETVGPGDLLDWGCIEQLDPRDGDSWMVTMPSSKGDTIQLKGFTLTQALGMMFSRFGGTLRYDVDELAERSTYVEV